MYCTMPEAMSRYASRIANSADTGQTPSGRHTMLLLSLSDACAHFRSSLSIKFLWARSNFLNQMLHLKHLMKTLIEQNSTYVNG